MDDFQTHYSSEVFNEKLREITSDNIPDQINSLQTISEILSISIEDNLDEFPLQDMCNAFVNIFSTTTLEPLEELAVRCMINILDAHTGSTRALMNAEMLSAMKNKYDAKKIKPEVVPYCVKALSILSNFRAEQVGQVLGLGIFFDSFDMFHLAEQRNALTGANRVTSNFIDQTFVQYLPRIASLFVSYDYSIAKDAMHCFYNIAKNTDITNLDNSAYESISVAVACILDQRIFELLSSVLKELTRTKLSFCEKLIDANLDYDRFFFYSECNETTLNKIRINILNAVLNILPSPEFPEGFWSQPKDIAKNINKFAKAIIPILIKILTTQTGNEKLIVCALAQAYLYEKIPLQPGIFQKLASICQNSQFSPFVLLLTEQIEDSKNVVSSGLFSQLGSHIPEEDSIAKWYQTHLEKLTQKIGPNFSSIFENREFSTIEELIDFININEFSPFDFAQAGMIKKSIDLIKPLQSTSLDFKKLRDTLFDLLVYFPIPAISDPFNGVNSQNFASRSIVFHIKRNEEKYSSISFKDVECFAGIEYWFNQEVNGIGNENLNIADPLSKLIKIEPLENKTYTELGILHRICKTPGYRKFKFEMNNKTYSYLDFLFVSFIRALKEPKDFNGTVFTVNLIDEDENNELKTTQLRSNSKKLQLDQKTKDILYCLKLISTKSCTIDLECPELEKRLVPLFSSLFLMTGMFSPCVRFASSFPFLFSSEFRTKVYKMTTFDMFSVLSIAHSTIFKNTDKLRENRLHYPCKVRRSEIFNDGCLLLSTLGAGPMQFDLSFDDEAGFGDGPLHEFFNLMSLEFVRKNRKMWRDSCDNDDKDFVWCENGLFPAPNADSELFKILGILCAKALTANTVVPLPLSDAFFKFISGRKMLVREVDPIFARSLQVKEGLYGLSFVYPGYDDLELCPDGANIVVNESNVDEYVDLVSNFTCGEHMKPIREAFNNGYNTCILGGMSILRPYEFKRMVTGDEVQISIDDMKKYVALEHGYNDRSPQIGMLFETIDEMDSEKKRLFIKFVTGCERLPIGGISALHPHITIARRIIEEGLAPDQALPTASTCTNYFKLPAYSCKSIMKEKLLIAIEEGQGAFLLS